MKPEKWLEILVVGIILSGLAWLLVQVFDMKGTVTSTAQRLDRIASVLPDIRVRIAQEELSKAIQLAVISTKPVEVSQGEWISAVHVLDTENRRLTTYRVKLQGPNDDRAMVLVTGSVFQSDDRAVPFSKLQEWSTEAKNPVLLPGYIEMSSSYILRTDPRMYARLLAVTQAEPQQHPLQADVTTWSTLAQVLKDRPKTFKVQ